MSQERRAVVTDSVKDFQPIHERIVAVGEEHFGMLFSLEPTMPRSKATVSLWVSALNDFLEDHSAEDALRNRTHFLP